MSDRRGIRERSFLMATQLRSNTLSVKSILERQPGVALNQIGWDAELTSTGLPFIERNATKEARLADNALSRDDCVRLEL